MLIIKPVQDKKDQEAFCAACGVDYDADLLCYAAWVDGELTGVSQFGLSGGVGHLIDLAPVKGGDDWDAMFIMGRQTMNFIDLHGIHSAVFDGKIEPAFAMKLGFIMQDGVWKVDLTHFFENPCRHGHGHSCGDSHSGAKNEEPKA